VKTHRFDPISLFFGIITIVVGFAAINSRLGKLVNDRPDALVPLLLLAAGVVAVVVATRRSLQDVDGASDDQHDSAQ
jgi:formate hydrogenlyase subunit 3/multisubunit Na+/H+ antiporter MnhD subunit